MIIFKFSNFQVFSKNNHQGQIALIILVVMSVALTLGLSLSQRVLTDVTISEKEQESAKAFSAAEAGIEEALRQLDIGSTSVSISSPSDLGVSDVEINIQEIGRTDEYIYPQSYLLPDETAIIWLCEHNEDGSLDIPNGYPSGDLTVCWHNNAALEIIYFYRDGTSYDIKRWAVDGGSGETNGFTDASGSVSVCTDLDHSYELTGLPGEPIFLALKPFYSQTPVGVYSGTANFPSQGYEIYSTGEVERSDEEMISRRIRVFRGYNALPDTFYNAIFSSNSIEAN